jgi:phosphoglucomutase
MAIAMAELIPQRRLFGTDGIRGVANQYPMTAEMALALGRSVAEHFRQRGRRCRIVIGKDTRLSGYMFESALEAGIVFGRRGRHAGGASAHPGHRLHHFQHARRRWRRH